MNDNGKVVVLDKHDSFIQCKQTKATQAVRYDRGVYELDLYVPVTETARKEAGF